MQIPVENIYYLLCYAWNEFAPLGMSSVAIEDCPNTLELFSRLIVTGLRALHRRGVGDWLRYAAGSDPYRAWPDRDERDHAMLINSAKEGHLHV